MHIIMPMHYVAKIEIEPFPPSGPPNFQNVVAPMIADKQMQVFVQCSLFLVFIHGYENQVEEGNKELIKTFTPFLRSAWRM